MTFSAFQIDCENAIRKIAESARLIVVRSELPDPLDPTVAGIKLLVGYHEIWLYHNGAQIDGRQKSTRFEIESYQSLDELRVVFQELAEQLLLSFKGPHEGREFDLMIGGKKPLSMFVLEEGESVTDYPDPRFDKLVARGRFIRSKKVQRMPQPDGGEKAVRRILYANVKEAWRIPAMHLVQEIYNSTSGWHPDLERQIGTLLGYDAADIELWLSTLPTPKEGHPWEGPCLEVAYEFAAKTAELYRANPYAEIRLTSIINTLMTELWDHGFSQSEIRRAFEDAIADMPRYAAGQESRGG